MRNFNDRPAPPLTRRAFLASSAAAGALAVMGAPHEARAAAGDLIKRAIPGSGEQIPIVGMGTWITFNVGGDETLRANRLEVMKTFFEKGGALVDSSPMYGSSEEVVGWCLSQLSEKPPLFSATKVWTMFQGWGVSQMEKSQSLWRLPRFDLMQIHNMLDWETHLETLKEWKAAGRLRYIGVTTSHGRRHGAFARAIESQPFDLVQFTYNIADREAEDRLLPLAAERRMGVIVNRPFQGGALFDTVKGKKLPAWASEFGCTNWAQFFLKFAVSHPAVTCAIPATSRVEHMAENMGAGLGRLPDPDMRKRMVRYFTDIG